MTVNRWAACAAGLFIMGACSSDGGTNPPPPPPPPLSFALHVEPTFTANCALGGCHVAPTPAGGLDLRQAQAFGNLVNVVSSQVPHLSRVTPNDPDSSYLIIKLIGDAALVGGVADQMPPGGALRAGQIDTIRLWIDAGAPNN